VQIWLSYKYSEHALKDNTPTHKTIRFVGFYLQKFHYCYSVEAMENELN